MMIGAGEEEKRTIIHRCLLGKTVCSVALPFVAVSRVCVENCYRNVMGRKRSAEASCFSRPRPLAAFSRRGAHAIDARVGANRGVEGPGHGAAQPSPTAYAKAATYNGEERGTCNLVYLVSSSERIDKATCFCRRRSLERASYAHVAVAAIAALNRFSNTYTSRVQPAPGVALTDIYNLCLITVSLRHPETASGCLLLRVRIVALAGLRCSPRSSSGP